MTTCDGQPVLLTLRALGLGDLLTVIPSLRALRRAFPEHCHVLATSAQLLPLVALVGAVDEVVPYDGIGARLGSEALPSFVRDVDVAVNLHGAGPESHRLLLGTSPRRLVAFAHPDVPASSGGPPWPPDAHEVWRWCGLLSSQGIPADPVDLHVDVPPDPTLPAGDDVTIVHPGASSGARRWPVERFAAVARAEAGAGRRVVVTGGPTERLLVEEVVHLADLPPDADRCGTELRQLCALVAGAGRVVCGDTGVAHLATATVTPSVVLFGPTSPDRWGPPADRPWHRALWSGRTGDPHGHDPDPGLLQLTVDDVLAALAELAPRPDRSVRLDEPDRAEGAGPTS